MTDTNRIFYDDIHFAIDNRYTIQKLLGKGTYGVVCQATETGASNGRRIAIKKVMKIFTNEILVKRAFRELRLMRHFRGHKNIISLYDLDMVTIHPYDGLYCYQELMDLDLARLLQGPIELSDLHVQSMVYQILCGIKYIHSANVIHRDLKPGNILINAQGQLKICDFGLARGILDDTERNRIKITKYVATRWYRAPELIISNKIYTTAIDMWSVGCILCEFFGRKPIFKGKDHITQLTSIIQVLGTPPRKLIMDIGSEKAWEFFDSAVHYFKIPFQNIYPSANNEALSLLDELLKYDPRERITAPQALTHPFLRMFHLPEDEPEAPEKFNFDFEQLNPSELKHALRDEVQSFRKEIRGEKYVTSKRQHAPSIVSRNDPIPGSSENCRFP
ncbi:similar to Saccharomyces cerevisiae YHR030C SLT2 Serine/threonine MAP kinase [Geotrichum candidum]|uniref:Similar to Saccharomyces cerevisiae YHR030C SLT2 Serine/threonine MAP kinase n=1 Tax=Geotrichum candidum TaxID=1173061 RepID=A0A0J9XA01_GEOCN|nr:similar to Saccharomyces cerevisiae YHR030C SLT2 Serine/threonine MAP kinase [Geotrichum candidum]